MARRKRLKKVVGDLEAQKQSAASSELRIVNKMFHSNWELMNQVMSLAWSWKMMRSLLI